MAKREIVLEMTLEGDVFNQFAALTKQQQQARAEMTRIRKELRLLDKDTAGYDQEVIRLNKDLARFDVIATNASVQMRELRNDLSGATTAGLRFRDKMAQATKDAIIPFGGAIGIATVATAAAVHGVVELGKELVGLSAQIQARDRKAVIVFGDALDEVTRKAEQNALAMGLTTREYIDAAAGVQDLLVPLGFARDEAAGLSTEVTDLAGALSLWSGGQVDAAEAAERLQKGLLGETESLKALGIVIDQSSKEYNERIRLLQEENNITKQQARALDILRQVQDQTTDAQANYASGTESLLQLQQRANAELRQAKEELAVGLTPAFIAVTKAQANFVTGITDFLNSSKTLQERILSLAGTGTGIPLLATALRLVSGAAFDAIDGVDLTGKSLDELNERLEMLTNLRDKLIQQGDTEGASFQQQYIDQVKAAIVNHKDYAEAVQQTTQAQEQEIVTLAKLKEELKALQEQQAQSATREQFLEVQKLIDAKNAEITAITGTTKALKSDNDERAKQLEYLREINDLIAQEALRDLPSNERQLIPIEDLLPSEEEFEGEFDSIIATYQRGLTELELLDFQYKTGQIDSDIEYWTRRGELVDEYNDRVAASTAQLAGTLASFYDRDSQEFKAFAIIEASINAYRAASEALADKSAGPTRYAQAAIALAQGLSYVSAIQGFAEGGFTGSGSKYQPRGVVHAGEWVAPAWQVRSPQFAPIIDWLESQRKNRGGYEMPFVSGGFVPETISTADINSLEQRITAQLLANRPMYVDVVEINKAQGRVRVADTLSTA